MASDSQWEKTEENAFEATDDVPGDPARDPGEHEAETMRDLEDDLGDDD